LKNIREQKEINEEWENIKTIIESAEETIRSQKKSLQSMNGGMKSVYKPLHV